MKKMKNLRSKIFVILGLFALMIADLNPFFVNAGRENLTYRNAGYPAAMFDNNLNRYTQYGISTVGGNQSYCIDYGYKAPASGASLTYLKTVRSNKLVAVMANGYPNKSVAQLGAVNIDAAYLGTQMAVWQTVNGTSYTKGNAFDLNKIQPAAGYENVVNNAKQVAAKILASGTYNPTISVSGGKVDYDSYVEMNKIGPFKVNVEGYKYTTFKTSLVNAPEGSYVVDKDNHIRNEYNAGEEVYVLVSKTAAPKNVTLKVTAVANEKVAVLYGAGSSMQNFVFLDFEQKTIEASKQFTWEKREGNIEIVKVDQNGASVEGAEFKVVDESGKQVAKQKTNKEGKITIKGLPVGKYTVTEISAPEGYILNAETKTVTVKTGETARIKAVNEKIIGGLEITKIDEDTKEKIEGVTFEVYNSNKEVIGKITTGKDGKAVLKIDNMANGTYYYKEISAPDGYIVDSTMKEFKITEENKIAKVTVTNKKIRGTLEITKLDDSRVAIEGVKFNILASDKKTVIETLTTDKSGYATTKKLDKGTYYYQEIEVPDGYVKDDEIFEFQINKQNEIVKREVINKKITGKLEITKLDDTRVGIKGVKFNILASDKKTVIETLTTDKTGYAETKKLDKGTYYYQEVEVPDGYVKDDEIFEFQINELNEVVKREVINYRVKGSLEILKIDEDSKAPIEGVKFNILDSKGKVVTTVTTDKNGKAEVKDLVKGTYYYQEIEAPAFYEFNNKKIKFKINTNNEVIKETVTNKKITGTIKITKVDDAKQPVEGVVFEIKDEQGKLVDTIKTDKNGIAVSNEPLVKGIYTYQEISAPEEYIMDTSVYKFEVKNVNQIIKKTVKNERVRGYIEITKVDDSNNPIKGVKFDILDSNHKKVDTITTDSNGKATSKDLLIGKYYYKEVSAPKEYVMDSNEYEFEVTAKNTQVLKTVENKRSAASLKIIKLDKTTKAPIEGVTFEVLDANKNVIDTIVTDKDGIARSKDLVLGKYYYREVSAPDKYIVDSKEKSFTLGENGEIFEATVYNEAKTLPVTGGSLSLDMLIVLIVAGLSVAGFTTMKVVKAKKEQN